MDNLVEISKNKQIVTTSKRIADTFGKQHSHVIRTINNIIRALRGEEDLRQSNFGLTSYYDVQGKQQKQYIVTRDGFTLLAMGFTGKKALSFKIKYINAFNEMEAKLREKNALTAYPCGEVAVREHTRALPVCRKKEIVLSAKAKEEIGGIVKAVVKAEINNLLPLVPAGAAEGFEVTDQDLLMQLYRWNATRNWKNTLVCRELSAENNKLKDRSLQIKKAFAALG